MSEGIDLHIRDVKPVGATTPYASPEQLRSLQFHFEGSNNDDDLLINGHMSDQYSADVVLYELLTGELPFQPRYEPEMSAPDTVPLHLRDMWEEYESILESYQVWVSIGQLMACFGRRCDPCHVLSWQLMGATNVCLCKGSLLWHKLACTD